MKNGFFCKGDRIKLFDMPSNDPHGFKNGDTGTVDEDRSTCPFVLMDKDGKLHCFESENLALILRKNLPDPEGWIDWNGGTCPVPHATAVAIRRADGVILDHRVAGELTWNGSIYPEWEIVAYRILTAALIAPQLDIREHTGGSVSYYGIELADGTKVQCNDVIKALNMTYAEGNVFKAVWRIAAARQGKSKRGYDDALYDAEKVVFFGSDMIDAAKAAK